MPDEPFDLLFWLDLESSGLEIGRDRILEIAWFFTDSDLRLLTPLRQRLACIEPAYQRVGPGDEVFDPKSPRHWDEPEFFDQRGKTPGFVQQMHKSSSLCEDHLIAAPEMVLTDARHFERMYLDDLFAAKETSGGEADYRVVIAGAGVSHMDVHMLADLLPDRFPLMPSPDGSSGMAYWHYDVSTAVRCLSPEVMLKAHEWLRTDPECPFDILACEAGDDQWNESHIVKPSGGHVSMSMFDLDGAVRHRALSDVVESLVDARLIRRLNLIPDVLTSQL